MSDDELKALLVDLKRHVDVTAEATRADIRLVAERLLTIEQKIDRHFCTGRNSESQRGSQQLR